MKKDMRRVFAKLAGVRVDENIEHAKVFSVRRGFAFLSNGRAVPLQSGQEVRAGDTVIHVRKKGSPHGVLVRA